MRKKKEEKKTPLKHSRLCSTDRHLDLQKLQDDVSCHQKQTLERPVNMTVKGKSTGLVTEYRLVSLVISDYFFIFFKAQPKHSGECRRRFFFTPV